MQGNQPQEKLLGLKILPQLFNTVRSSTKYFFNFPYYLQNVTQLHFEYLIKELPKLCCRNHCNKSKFLVCFRNLSYKSKFLCCRNHSNKSKFLIYLRNPSNKSQFLHLFGKQLTGFLWSLIGHSSSAEIRKYNKKSTTSSQLKISEKWISAQHCEAEGGIL